MEAVSQKLDRPIVNPSKKFGETKIIIRIHLHPYRLFTL